MYIHVFYQHIWHATEEIDGFIMSKIRLPCNSHGYKRNTTEQMQQSTTHSC